MPTESEKIYLGFTKTDHQDNYDQKLDQKYIVLIKEQLE